MIGAQVQQQNQNLLRLQQAIKYISELLSKRSVQLRSQKRYAAKPTSNPCGANARMRRTPLYQRSRHRYTNHCFPLLPLCQRYSNAAFSGSSLRQCPCSFFSYFVRGDERCRSLVPSPYRLRKAPTKFVRRDRGMEAKHGMWKIVSTLLRMKD